MAIRVSAYGRRYNSRAIARARALAKAGWSHRKISTILERELGVAPSQRTISSWCRSDKSAERREADRRRKRLAYRAAKPSPSPHVSEDWKLEQMQALFDRHVSLRAIGIVSRQFWGEEHTQDEVRKRLGLRSGAVRSSRQ